MTAFITGSHAYGIPTENSDIDLAILVSDKDSEFLWQQFGSAGTLRAGKLNIVCFYNATNFERWREVTNQLKARAPVTRDDAVSAFQVAGFKGYPTEHERLDTSEKGDS